MASLGSYPIPECAVIDTTIIKTEDLEGFDIMMMETAGTVPTVSALAKVIWAEVLRELDMRGRVELLSGSYDDFATAQIRRRYP